MENYIKLLGKKGKDVVTGSTGVITSVSYDLYGCIQVIITPLSKEKGALVPGAWFDVARIVVTDETPVMTPPDFETVDVAKGEKGCEYKPVP